MIRVSCPKCKAILQVDDKHAGQVIACSNCKTSLRLPQAQPAPPVASSPPTLPTSSEAATSSPFDMTDVQTAKGTGGSTAKNQATTVARLKTAWQTTKTPIKAAIIGGTSVVVLSCFLCCGIFGFNTFRRSPDGKAKDGGAAPPNIAKLDFAKGPNGEEVAKVEEGKKVFFAFRDKKKAQIRHGLFMEFFDKGKAKKKVEGNFFAGEWHGTVTRWYESGEKRNERYYDRGKGTGTHKGFKKDGSLAWELGFDSNGVPLMTKAPVEAFVDLYADKFGTGRWKKVKSEAGAFEELQNPESRKPSGSMPVDIYRCDSDGFWTDTTHGLIADTFGTPIRRFATYRGHKPGFPPHFVYVYQCNDGFVRLRVDNIGQFDPAMPQPNEKVTPSTVLLVSGNKDF